MKSILIIGAGVGGLSAGIYGQANGFATTIFEAHKLPGGQCTSWKRKGYTFDACIHHFGAGSGTTRVDAFWREVGALPCEMLPTQECVSVAFPDGTIIHDYFDLEKLERHLKTISPQDAALIDDYLDGIRGWLKDDRFNDMMLGSIREKVAAVPSFLRQWKNLSQTLGTFGSRFQHPALRQAFPLLHSSIPGFPLFVHQVKHAYALKGDLAWPRGGSMTIARNMAECYQQLGGTLHCRQKVVMILTEDDRACGVELEDGSRHYADFILSNADGRKTILDLLSGKYLDEQTARYCQPQPDHEVPFSVIVFLGVKRDLAQVPCAMVLFLEEPEVIAGVTCSQLDLQIYGFDSSMAPPGKGVIKVELFSKPSYFSNLVQDGAAYQVEKDRIAAQVIDLLEGYFPGLREDIEVIDVSTLHTWERYMGGTRGHSNFPNKDFSVLHSILGLDEQYTLPGLSNFYFVGQWVTAAGALIMNALSGKTAIQKICKQTGTKFTGPAKNLPH